MKVIGITGGVGAGKSTVLSMLCELCNCAVIMADDVAKELMEYGNPLSADAIRLFGEEAYDASHQLNRSHLASCIYSNPELRTAWNACVHPATYVRICELVQQAREENREFAFVEAALLIECHYESICDEFWYVYAAPQIRQERLALQRGYTPEKTAAIDSSQLSDEEFRKHCAFVIDTGIDFEYTRKQLENKLEQYV